MSEIPPTPPAPTGDIEPVLPLEGLHVIHCFFKFSNHASESGNGGTLQGVLEKIRSHADLQLLTFSTPGGKSDWGFMLLGADLHLVDCAAKEIQRAAGEFFHPVFSWLSLTERSEYTMSEDEYVAGLRAEGTHNPSELEAKLEEFRTRMAKYSKDRLYPLLPEWPVLCFYPMSKRRVPGQNWYALPFAERKELMKGHAKVGRTYAGRILQLITGSTGLDDMEWGVTLLAKTTSSIKEIVYEMRFDPVSAEYADFGEFYIGLVLPPDALIQRLGV